jgi:hypothetical protein
MRGGRNHIYNAYGCLYLAMFRVDGLVGASRPGSELPHLYLFRAIQHGGERLCAVFVDARRE